MKTLNVIQPQKFGVYVNREEKTITVLLGGTGSDSGGETSPLVNIYKGFPTPISGQVVIPSNEVVQGRTWTINYQGATAPTFRLGAGTMQKNILLNDFTANKLTRIMLHCVDASNKVFDITIKSMP